jgi:hypothetical protein
MDIEIEEEAAEFIREHGGNLYIWVEASGLLQTRMSQPDHDETWTGKTDHGVVVEVGASASEAERWRIVLHRLPRRHLSVTSNLTIAPRGTTAPGSA